MSVQTTETRPWIPADSFGSRLFLTRRAQKMTVEQIAHLCGVAQPTWTTWENGARPRDLVAVVQRIAAATGVDRDWLMWGGALAEPGGGPSRPQTVMTDRRNGASTDQCFGDSPDFAAAA